MMRPLPRLLLLAVATAVALTACSPARTPSSAVVHGAAAARDAAGAPTGVVRLGVSVLDAPVSGGQAGAENGQLAIMCGGSDADMTRGRPLMDCYAKAIVHVGPVGAGQTAKMANQMCIAGVLGGLSEAIRLAQGAGLDLDKTYEAISGGAAQS